MPKYIKGKDGKFSGSIGDGKHQVPTAAPAGIQRFVESGSDTSNSLDVLAARFAASKTEPTYPTREDILSRIDSDEYTNDNEYDEPYAVVDLGVDGMDNVATISGRVQEDLETGKFVAMAVWLRRKEDWEATSYSKYNENTADLATFDTKDEAVSYMTETLATRIPAEMRFLDAAVKVDPQHRTAAETNGYTLDYQEPRRLGDGGLPGAIFEAIPNSLIRPGERARNGYVSMQKDGSYLGVVRWRDNSTTTPTVQKFQDQDEAISWAQQLLSQPPGPDLAAPRTLN